MKDYRDREIEREQYLNDTYFNRRIQMWIDNAINEFADRYTNENNRFFDLAWAHLTMRKVLISSQDQANNFVIGFQDFVKQDIFEEAHDL